MILVRGTILASPFWDPVIQALKGKNTMNSW
jgi:hypothetical protein